MRPTPRAIAAIAAVGGYAALYRRGPALLDLAYRAIIVPADHIMATGMFGGLATRLTSQGGTAPR